LVPDYVAAPYPCRVQIVTSAGVRIVSLGTLPPISDQEVTALLDHAEQGQIINCQEWVHEDFWNAKLFLPKWLPDPPDLRQYFQQWQVVATGLSNHERVIVQTTSGEQLAELVGVEGSPAAVELLLDLRADPSDRTGIVLRRTATSAAESREIIIQQLVLTHAGTVVVGAPMLGLLAVPRGGGATFAAATSHGVAIYDLTVPARARLVEYLPAEGLKGITPWRDGMLAWGAFGVRPLGIGREAAALSDRPVLGAGIDGPRLYVLADNELRMHDRDGRTLARVDAGDATSLAVGDRVLLLGDRHGLRALDGISLVTIGAVQATAATALTRTRYAGTRAAFFAHTAGRESVYAVDTRDELIRVAHYVRRPLLVDAARSGRTYAALSTDRLTIEVYAAGRSATQRR
jgi:hypothetical protein